jgi:hypothetical protein
VNGLLGTPSKRGCFFFVSIFAITASSGYCILLAVTLVFVLGFLLKPELTET